MDFWNNALQAAKDAAVKAKDLGKRGLEVVEATAEEANRKLNLNLHDKVGAGGKAPPPSREELEAFGLTPEFAEWVRTLNYSAFRDFPPEHLLPVGGGASSSAGGGTPAYQLNPWQVRHATLVVQALKEVNELRFVLCPKYMADEHFWHVYFTLARKHLPDRAFDWPADEPLPSFGDAPQGDAFSLTSLGSQLRQLSSKLQSASASGRQRVGLELSNLASAARGGGSSSGSPSAAAAASGAAAGAAAAAAPVPAEPAAPPAGMLEEDPDLEAYLQVAISASQPGSTAGDELGAGDEDDDLDLDSYINELSAEVEAAAAAEEAAAAAHAGGAAAADAAGEPATAAAAEAEPAAAAAPAAPGSGKDAKKD